MPPRDSPGPVSQLGVRENSAPLTDLGPSQKGVVKIKIFGPVFLGSSQEMDPGTPLDRPGAPRTSLCTKKSDPETYSKAISRYPKNSARLPSGTQQDIKTGFGFG